ncbi:MAG: hypothetical protein K0U72_13525 [Gammaproteobacteria bacterium]|nr:hypothetical protein [Gammaproteobacteria bacterium]
MDSVCDAARPSFSRLAVAFCLIAVVGCNSNTGASIDEEGNPVAATFSKSYGGPGFDSAADGDAHPDGGYAFAGNMEQFAQFSISADGYLARMDANGNLIWQMGFGNRGVSADLLSGPYVAGYGGNDEFCIVSGADIQDATATTTTRVARDAYAARVTAGGQVVWETTFDSGGWAGYDYTVVTTGFLEAAETGIKAVGDGENGCYAVYESKATLLDASGNGFDGFDGSFNTDVNGNAVEGDTFVGASSMVLARLDANGNLLWQRRITNGAFTRSQGVVRTIPPVLIVTAQGVLLQYSWDSTNSRELSRSVVAHYSRDGRMQFIREYDTDDLVHRSVGPRSSIKFAQTDDLENGARDGQNNDGFAFAYNGQLRQLMQGGGVVWRQDISDFAVAGVTQQCFVSACFVFVIGTLDRQGTPNSGAVRAFDATTGNPVTGGGGVIPDMEEVFSIERIDADSIRLLGINTDGVALARDLSFLPPVNGTPQYRADADRLYPQYLRPVEKLRRGAIQQYPDGVVEYAGKVIEVASLTNGLSQFELGGEPEYVTAMVTTASGNHVVVGNKSTDGGRGFVIAFDDQGAIRWQYQTRERSKFENVVARANGGVVVTAKESFHSVQLLAFDEEGTLLWTTPQIGSAASGSSLPPIENRSRGAVSFDRGIASASGRILAKTSSGYLVGTATSDNSNDGTDDGWLFEVDENGQIAWLRSYNIFPQSATVLEDGTIKLAAEAVHGFIVATLDATGQVVSSDRYSLLRAETIWPQITDGGSGAVNVTVSTKYLAGGFSNGSQTPIGERNSTVVRIDAVGNPLWARIHGGLENEFSEAATGMADGGLFMSGRSGSLGDFTEMWLLRLGSDGLVDQSCNAFIAEIAGDLISRTPSSVADVSRAIPTDTPTYTLESPGFMTFGVELIEARQCLGQSTSGNPVPPTGGLIELTVNQAGSTVGLVSSTPGGLFCGGNTTQVCSSEFAPDSLVTLTVDDASASRFRGWGAGCVDTRSNPQRCIVEMDVAKTIDVFFEPFDGTTSLLTTNLIGLGRVYTADAPGIDCASDNSANDCSQVYQQGARVRLAIDSSYGGDFQGWQGDCAEWARAQTIRVSVDTDKICTAQFSGTAPQQRNLQVSVSLDGVPTIASQQVGNVQSSPSGIACANAGGANCSADFLDGTNVTLLARPETNFVFVRWTSTDPLSPCATTADFTVSMLMDQVRNCTAEFTRITTQTIPLSASVIFDGMAPQPNGPFGGRVISNPPGIDCGPAGSDCVERFAVGEFVELTATPEPGFRFLNWNNGSGTADCAPGIGAVASVRVTGIFECQALFQTIPPSRDVTVQFDAPATGARVVDVNTGTLDCTTACTVSFSIADSPVQLRPINGTATWTNWFNCDSVIDDPANPTGPRLCSIDITAGARTVTAEFL